ncbi:hypothetical protein ACA910_005037 [Epithemia clementina (nom. ined.)]
MARASSLPGSVVRQPRALPDNDDDNNNNGKPRVIRDFPWDHVIPWALVLTLSVTLAGYTQYKSYFSRDEDEHVEESLQRWLVEEAKHVFNEDHPPLFPLTRSDYIGFFLAIVGLMIAAGGGIGGGGILVPIYCLVMGFSPKHAIPLSNITVFGGSIANTLLNASKRHPLADRPLVDWDLILVMEPLTIAGALIGAFLNKVLPELLLTILLVLLLSFTAWSTLNKAFRMYKKETEELRKRATWESELTRTFIAQQSNPDPHDEEVEGLVEGGTKTAEKEKFMDEPKVSDQSEKREQSARDEDDSAAEHDPHHEAEKLLEARRQAELEQILYEEKHVPVANVMVLVTLFIVVLGINILKGGGAFPSPLGIVCGSQGFWVANFIMLGWIVVVSLFIRAYLVRRWEQKKRCGYCYCEGDIQWDGRATIVYPFVCCFAGFFAGMFGVGGGIVKGPLMLAMNVHPAVSAASSACMILFTSFTATTSFIVFGLLVVDYAVVGLVIGFIATIVGQVGLSYLAKKAQRNSFIAFSIGGVVLLSAFLMTVQSLLSMAEGEQHHAGGICGKGD